MFKIKKRIINIKISFLFSLPDSLNIKNLGRETTKIVVVVVMMMMMMVIFIVIVYGL
jgi:hypothetical protein